MSAKAKKAFSRMNMKLKLVTTLLIFTIFLTGFILIAAAGSGINFNNQTPAQSSATGNTTPAISVDSSVYSGTITIDDIEMTLNGVPVSPTLTSSLDSYTITYMPAHKLADGTQSVSVSVYDESAGVKSTNWSFTVDAAPKLSSMYPANGSTVVVSNPQVSVYVKDTYDNLNGESLSVKLNGQPIAAAFQYKGYLDSCSNTYIVESYKEGTIRFNTSGLANGTYTVDVSMADRAGNVLHDTWSFTVDALPLPSKWTPAKNSTVSTSSPEISVYVTARAVELNPLSVSAKLNGQPVAAVLQYRGYLDSCTDAWIITSRKEGTVKFNTSGLQDGLHTVEISVADKAGNVLQDTWSFTVAEAPKLTSLLPADGTKNTGVMGLSAFIRDNTAVNPDTIRLYINNKEVPHTYSEDTGELTYSYNFPSGSYQVKLEASDTTGNKSTTSWNFLTDSSPPDLTEMKYFSEGMTISNGVLTFYAQVNDLFDIKDTATLKLNGTPLEIDFSYKGYYDSCTSVYITQSKKEAYISYDKQVFDGENLTLELFVEDILGNGKTWTWSVNVQGSPTIEPPAEDGQIFWEDNFDGSALDTAKWNTQLLFGGKRWASTTTGNHHFNPGIWQDVSLYPYGSQQPTGVPLTFQEPFASQNLTAPTPYGSLTVQNGFASFSNGVARTFPYIWAGPENAIFPATGDFSLEFRMKWDTFAYHGAGFAVINTTNMQQVGNNPPSGNAVKTIFSLWGDASRIQDKSFHTYKLTYSEGRYSSYIDGVLQNSWISSVRPNALWLGNPVFTHWGTSDWTDFTVDYVRVYAVTENQPPVVTVDVASVTVDEGQTAINTGNVTDADNDPVSLSASVGSIINNNDGTFSWSSKTSDDPTDSQEVTITADDGNGGITQTTFDLVVHNVAPVVSPIAGPLDALQVGSQISLETTFSDAGVLDTHEAVWQWGDGTSSIGTLNAANGSGTVSGSHNYTESGVYSITLTVIDKDGGRVDSVYKYCVVFNPQMDFITGGGFITSPKGSYPSDPSIESKANFGFNIKYRKDSLIPTGQTEYQNKAANLNFHSTSYDWMVSSGPMVLFKGSGTINKSGDYAFVVSVIDGKFTVDTDKFRIKIWDKSSNKVIYDTMPGEENYIYPVTPLSGGNIVVH